MGAVVTCPGCKRSYAFKPELAGKTVKCKCGHALKLPAQGAASREKGGCPNCKAPLPDGAVLCTKCGFNRKTGKLVGGVAPANRSTRAPARVEAVSQPDSNRKWIGLAAVVVLLGAAGVVTYMTMFRGETESDPPPVVQTPTPVAPVPDPGVTEPAVPDTPTTTPTPPPVVAPRPTSPNVARLLAGPAEGTTCVAMSSVGNLAATGGGDKTLRLWNPDTGDELRRITLSAVPLEVRFSRDGQNVLAVSQDRVVSLWNASSGEPGKKYVHPTAVSGARCVTSEQVVIAAGADLLVWNVSADKPERTIPTGSPISVFDVSPDGGRIVTGHAQTGMLRIWDTAQGTRLAQRRHRTSRIDPMTMPPEERGAFQSLHAVVFLDDQRVLAAGSSGYCIWRWDGGDPISELEFTQPELKHWAAIGPLLITGRGGRGVSVLDTSAETLATAAGSQRSGGPVELNLESEGYLDMAGAGERLIFGGGGEWRAGAWTPNRRAKIQIVEVSRLRDAVAAERAALEKSLQDTQDALAKATEALAQGNATAAQLQVLAAHLPTEISRPVAEFGDAASGVTRMAFSPEGNLLVAGGADGTVRLYDFTSRQELRKLQAHSAPVTDVSFAADGRRLLSTSVDGSAVVWNVDSGEIECRLPGPAMMRRGALLADGKQAVTTALGMQLWDLQAERMLIQVGDSETRALAARENGLVAYGDQAGNVTVYDTRTRRQVAKRHFGQPDSTIQALQFAGNDALWIYHPPSESASRWVWSTNTITPVFGDFRGSISHDGTWWAGSDGAIGKLADAAVSVRIEKAGAAGGLFDPGDGFVVYTDGGVLTGSAFRPLGSGRIRVYDFNKLKEAADLLSKVNKNAAGGAGN